MLQIRKRNAGKAPLWLVGSTYTIGSDIRCDLPAEGNVQPLHAELRVAGDEAFIVNKHGASNIYLGDVLVQTEEKLYAGATLTVGETVFEILDPKRHTTAPVQPTITPPPSSEWYLKSLSTGLSHKEFALKKTNVIGRASDCDIALAVVHLSRHHAKLTLTDKGVLIEDLHSSNGTFVNGRRVESCTLRNGDEISFDSLKFKVIGPEIEDAEPASDTDKTIIRSVSVSDFQTMVRPAVSVSRDMPAAPKTGRSASQSSLSSNEKAPQDIPSDKRVLEDGNDSLDRKNRFPKEDVETFAVGDVIAETQSLSVNSLEAEEQKRALKKSKQEKRLHKLLVLLFLVLGAGAYWYFMQV